jgi:DNA (cytosine-5)-methyltransferase 1
MKVLNLYCGIGGNRKLWKNVDVTAVENNPEIAKIYKNHFPQDTVIIGDAHQYLLEHYKEFDFIWSSPPCQTHSSFRFNICVRFRGTTPEYPDMKLYQEILFLKHHFTGKYVVENVKPYYTPLISPNKVLQRHLFWCNFDIKDIQILKDDIRHAQIPQLQEKFGFNLENYKLSNKRQILRNCVEPLLGQHILNCAVGDL